MNGNGNEDSKIHQLQYYTEGLCSQVNAELIRRLKLMLAIIKT